MRSTGNNPAFTTWPENALATWVLHALDSGDADVKSTTFQGREAWALTLDFKPGDDYYDTYGARVDVIVDKETGLLLQLTQYENDPSYWTSIETIHNLQLDTATSRSDFVLPVPAGTKVIRHDYGYTRSTPRRNVGDRRLRAAPPERHGWPHSHAARGGQAVADSPSCPGCGVRSSAMR